jgi:DNA-directed RNA polymerase beta subunit
MKKTATIEKKYFARYKKPLIEFPNLIQDQLASFNWLVEKGLAEVFKEFSPINDYSEKKFQLDFTSFSLSEPKFDEEYTKVNKLTYEGQLKCRVKLLNKSIGTSKEQEIFMADVPLMTRHGTFIINGVERVIVGQLTRSFGVFFTEQESKGKRYFGAKIIPARGVWIEIESDPDGGIYVRIDKKRKFSVASLLRVLGLSTDEAMLKAFSSKHDKHEEIQKVLDDIDHLGQRRVRYVGEMFQQKIRMGMAQIKRNIQDRMSTIDVLLQHCRSKSSTNVRSRLVLKNSSHQPALTVHEPRKCLAEVEHLRTLSALGPGGLTRERAGLEVRDVHTSHYGRVCPIHTPEGPNIGLILHFSNYARVNDFGIIETPYVKVKKVKSLMRLCT